MLRRLIILLVLVILVSTVFVVSADEDEIPVYTIAITAEGLEVPEGIEPGLATLVWDNTAQGEDVFSFAILVQLNEGATLGDFFAWMGAQMTGEDPGEPVAVIRGGPALSGGTSLTATYLFEPGEYVFLDAGRAEPAVVPYTIEGELPEYLEAPEADVEIELVDFSFGIPEEIEAGEVVVGLSNGGAENHEIVMMRILNDELSDEEVIELAKSGEGAEEDYERIFAFVGMDPETQAWIPVELEAGRYLLLCNAPAAEDGEPHLMKGMIRIMHVS